MVPRRVMALDGVILDAPDTPENVARFEKKEHKNGLSAYPQVRLVGLAECGTHAIVAAELDRCASTNATSPNACSTILPHKSKLL